MTEGARLFGIVWRPSCGENIKHFLTVYIERKLFYSVTLTKNTSYKHQFTIKIKKIKEK